VEPYEPPEALLGPAERERENAHLSARDRDENASWKSWYTG